MGVHGSVCLVGSPTTDRSTEGDPTAAGAANMAPKRLTQATSFWPNDLRNDKSLEEGLQRVKQAMQDAVLRQVETDCFGYSSVSSKDAGLPVGHTTNTNQLREKHAKFLNALPSYFGYGGGKSKCYYCPCTGL